MKSIKFIYFIINIVSCCGLILYVLKDIIHNKEASTFLNVLLLSLVIMNYIIIKNTLNNKNNK